MSKLDERWDRLAAGTLTEAEHDELLGLADASGEAYDAYQAFKPLGPAFQQNVAAAILARQSEERAAAAEEVERPPDAPPFQGRPAPRGFLRWAGGLAAAAMMAAGIVFYPPQPTGYRIEISQAGRAGELRSANEAAPPKIFQPGGPFELLARADRDGAAPAEGLFYLHQAGNLVVLPEVRKLGDNFTCGGTLPPLPGFTAGEAQLVFVYAPPGRLPAPAALRQALAAGVEGGAWHWDLKSVRVEPGV